MLGEKEKQKKKQEVSALGNHATMHIDWLIFFIVTVTGPGIGRLSWQMNSRNAP